MTVQPPIPININISILIFTSCISQVHTLNFPVTKWLALFMNENIDKVKFEYCFFLPILTCL